LSPKPATIRQHCCQKHNVAGFGDIVAGFGDNVAVFGDIVAGVDGALNARIWFQKFPMTVQSVLKRVDGWGVNNMLWQLVSMLDDPAAERSVS